MPGGYLYGWYENGVNSKWVKMQCDASGFLKVDPGELFENPPVEDQAKKGPSSEWAYDHWKNAAAHHAKYTDAEAIDANFPRILTLTTGNYADTDLTNYDLVMLDTSGGDINLYGFAGGSEGKTVFFVKANDVGGVHIWNTHGSAAAGCKIITTNFGTQSIAANKLTNFYLIWTATLWRLDKYMINHIDDLFQNVPADNEMLRGPTSNWAYDHNANVAAHHARYTDLEAQTACKLNGSLYWSIPGSSFMETDAYNAQVTRIVTGTMTVDAFTQAFIGTVNLPNGVTVTGAICYGNAAAEDKTWTLRRVKLSDLTNATLATAVINTEDTTIDNATIDNSLYAYFFYTNSFEVGEILYGARITYTL